MDLLEETVAVEPRIFNVHPYSYDGILAISLGSVVSYGYQNTNSIELLTYHVL